MKILLVEDTTKHAEDAKAVLSAAGLEFVHVRTMSDAIDLLEFAELEGITHVITDLFILAGRRCTDHLTEEPCGVGVMVMARHKNLPCVICTAGHHHGPRYDWITYMGRLVGWPEMVDHASARLNTDEAHTKDWGRALKEVGISQSVHMD
jgi:CheY-like chemotaxis protein